MGGERTIKKYANRRLYDSTTSRHVTLEDIRALIVAGEKIRVIEDKTGADITRLVLLHVIAEQEQFGQPMLSAQLLESIIRVHGSAGQESRAGGLQSIDSLVAQQETAPAAPDAARARKINGSGDD
jgi:polyhydroxyalkanoate synthesis repressor PhaR